MKHVLLIFTLFCASYMTVNAQTNTWTGAGANTNWNTVANWSLNAMPTAANDVVIPTGFTVNLNVAGDTKSIVVQGNSTFNMSNTLSILNASSVAANATCAWTLGSLTGGGTLTNNGTFNLSSGNTKSIVGVTTFNNTGNFNILDGGDLNITDGIFNNLALGVIDLRGIEGNISYTGSASRILNNAGLIKSTATGGNVRIQTVLNNNGGTITVSNGNLIFDFLDKNLNGGVLNVSVGSVLRLTSTTNLTGTLTGALNGDLEWSGNVSSAGTSTFNFSGSSGVRWTAGNLTGGGTLVNKNLIFLSSGNTKSIIGVTTLNNEGDFNITDGGDFNITDGIFNNQLTGTIDMQWAEGNISYTGSASRILNNAGLIKSTATGGNVRIQTVLNNNGGTITVSNGNLIFDFLDKNLNGGVLNVSVGSVLRLTSTTNLTGTLTGALNGDLEWSGNVSSAGTSTFNFSGSSGVRWTAGNLTGGGTLVKKNLIFLSSGNTKSIIGATTLNNEGDFNITDGGDFNITDGIFNNQSAGTIDMQGAEGNISYTGSASRILNNFGMLKRTTTAGNARIHTFLNNSGSIDAQAGTLVFSEFLAFTNDEEGVVKGVSTVTIANTANYTNNGTFSPGGSPGTLTFNGVFKSSTTSVLDVELNGLTSGTQYDVLAITGTNAIFDGDVNVTLGFEPVVGNTFTVATTTGTITTKSLATPFTSDYLGKRYTFNVTYPNDNVVRLTISNILDIEAPNVITQNATVQLNASGNGSITAAQINNGSSDNCSLVADLTYTLSKSTFNCSNLGANTVTLTVTDEAGNSANQTATVTVVDAINPTVTCGGDSTIDSNGNYALPNYVTNSTASASDNCSATVVQAPVAGTSLADGTYTISFVATDSSGNTANCSFSLTVVDTTLGIDDFELSESSIQLYPNPVGNVLTIKNVNNLELDNAQITDVTGKVITTFDLKNMGLTKEISLEDLSSGMYFLKINGLNSSVTKRVIKQ
ncbi:T9SS type A sorting domain-containing protein [Subsaximicrobium wynnwilliamsii]|uniref:beta strand repeat-containing protein n=1 Tax=Subsaximicrobium wynnwilliamsii TaxID=291179 RepID=UPI0011BEAF8B|nr:T9SS type A sorting domain-containing protein [Subsaximicrobium wynnwilliamsii]TXD84618.1 T9SS type A sorting domain-containing protein [Subsaximicrobium wynnwilliamsii]